MIGVETAPTHTAASGRTRKAWYAAPYPSSFHWHEDIKYVPWRAPGPGSYALKRDITVLFIGSTRASQRGARQLRTALHAQCRKHNTCLWHETSHSCNGVVNASHTMLMFKKAVFCPAPAGDSITRKSIFDSLASGCIPVLFSKASLRLYSLHISEAQMDKISVYIPLHDVLTEDADFVHILNAISSEKILEMQKEIEMIAPTLQYAVVPSRLGDIGEWSYLHITAVSMVTLLYFGCRL